MRYAHTNLICDDWKTLQRFYVNVFKCKIVPPVRNQEGKWLDKGVGVKDAKLSGVHLRLPGYGKKGPTLELYSYDKNIRNDKVQPNQRGYGHLAFEVKNVKKTLSKVLKQGGSANGEISRNKVKGVGIITFIYVRDPEGNLIELQNWEKIK